MSQSESYRESHKNKGQDYHDAFLESPHKALLWHLEQEVIKKILRSFYSTRKPRYLDFACGTGRILGFMENYAESVIGVDVSASMLEVARSSVEIATIMEADITTRNVLKGQRFDLITAFRFFPNAEPVLRNEVISVLTELLDNDGLLVFNNHMTDTSFARKFMRLFGRGRGHTMTHSEVYQLVCGAGMEIIKQYPLGILPLNDKFMIRPRWIVRKIETVLSLLPGVSGLAQDIIYVCRMR